MRDLHRPRTQRIGVERNDDTRLFEMGDMTVVAFRPACQIIGIPARTGHVLQQRCKLAQQCRRGYGGGKDMQWRRAASAVRGMAEQFAEEFVPPVDGLTAPDGARAVGIVEIEDFGFTENIRRSQAGGMARIAGDLDRPSIDRFDDNPARKSAERQRCRIIFRFAGDEAFGHVDIGQYFFIRLRAASEGGRHAGGQQLQRRSPADGDWAVVAGRRR